MEGCQKIDLELEADGLIDGAVNAEKAVDIGLSIDENDHLPELQESMEPGRTKKNGRYNLRKSLAWDSAFFTSAGVLDAEELTSMITQADKGEKHFLPGIQEDITGSTESISTRESDNLTLENVDDDLFSDIRASIQRSSKKASHLANSSNKTAAEVVDSAAISSLRKQEIASQNKNPKPGLKKKSGLEAVRMSKCQPKQNIGKLGSAKAIKQDSGHSQMTSTAKSVATNTKPPKLPKTVSSSIPTSTAAAKRESVGTSRLKSDGGSSKLATIPSKGTQPPKVSVLSGARRALPNSALKAKSSLSGSSNTSRMQSARSSTSSDSSSNTSSGASSKSTLMAARRNPGKSSNVGTSPSISIPKTPSKTGLKNKPPSSNLSAYLMSSKMSASVSPASSISEWSSASSSSSSMVNPRCNNSRTSLDASSRRSVDLDSSNHSADRNADRNKNHGVVNNSKRSSTQTGILQAPGKPSGLRMPSPKIGFFDGVKSGARTPNGAPTSSPIRSSNSKLKSAKVPTARTATSSASIKLGSPKAAYPPSSQKKSHALVDVSDIPKDVKDFLVSFQEKSHALVDASDIPKDVKDSLVSFQEKPHALVDASDVPTDAKDSPVSFEEKSRALIDASDVPTAPKDSRASFEGKSHAFAIASDVPTDVKYSAASFQEKMHALVHISEVPTDAKNSPASFEEKSHALVNAYGFATDVKDSPGSSLGVKGNTTGESCQKAGKVQSEDAVNQVVIMKENLSDFDLHKNTGSVDTKNPSVEVINASDSENIDQIGDVQVNRDHHLEKNSDPIYEATNNEDSCANYKGEVLQGDNEDIYHNVHGLSDELLSDTSERALSFPPTASESAHSRTPLAPKNSFCSNECIDMSKDLTSQLTVADKTCFMLPSSEQKENS